MPNNSKIQLCPACGLIVGPVIGMKLFALEPSALWLTCGALGVLAAAIIFVPGGAQPAQSSPERERPSNSPREPQCRQMN